MTHIITVGDPSFSAEELGEAQVDALDFAAPGVPRLAPAISLKVARADGESWAGSFFGADDPFSIVVLGVSPPRASAGLLVVAGGVGYLVPVDNPETYRVIALRPIRNALVSEEDRLVVLVGYSRLTGLGAQNDMWTSRDLVSDGFREVRLARDTIVA